MKNVYLHKNPQSSFYFNSMLRDIKFDKVGMCKIKIYRSIFDNYFR